MVDVAHDRDDGRARHTGSRGRRGLAVLAGLRFRRDAGELELLLEGHDRRFDADFPGDLHGRRRVERLVHRRHDPALQEQALDVLGEDAELLGELLDRDALGEEDGAGRRRLLELEQLAGVVGAGFFRGAADRGLGDRPRLRGFPRAVGVALVRQRKLDVGVGVLDVGAQESARIDFVRHGDLGLGAALLCGLLGGFLGLCLFPLAGAVEARRRHGSRSHTGTRTVHAGARRAAGHASSGRAGSRAIDARAWPRWTAQGWTAGGLSGETGLVRARRANPGSRAA